MNALCILTIYNEEQYLPLKQQFCKDHDLDLYVIDNMSDDRSWDWLQDNNIKSHRFDTGGMFDLKALQDEIIRTLHKLKDKPDWVIYNGCDLFPIALPTLKEELQRIDDAGGNVAYMQYKGFRNTGEEFNTTPADTYFYCNPSVRKFKMFHKYNKVIRYNADDVSIGGPNIPRDLSGLMVNYGHTKSKEERNETLARREKAWKAGVTPRGHGAHYVAGKNTDWVWDKSQLLDIRTTPEYKYIQSLQKTMEECK